MSVNLSSGRFSGGQKCLAIRNSRAEELRAPRLAARFVIADARVSSILIYAQQSIPF